jgi:hypothetical protein
MFTPRILFRKPQYAKSLLFEMNLSPRSPTLASFPFLPLHQPRVSILTATTPTYWNQSSLVVCGLVLPEYISPSRPLNSTRCSQERSSAKTLPRSSKSLIWERAGCFYIQPVCYLELLPGSPLSWFIFASICQARYFWEMLLRQDNMGPRWFLWSVLNNSFRSHCMHYCYSVVPSQWITLLEEFPFIPRRIG